MHNYLYNIGDKKFSNLTQLVLEFYVFNCFLIITKSVSVVIVIKDNKVNIFPHIIICCTAIDKKKVACAKQAIMIFSINLSV